MVVKKAKVMNGQWNTCAWTGGVNFGLILLLIGIYMLGRDLGWIESSVSFWTLLVLVIALTFIMGGFRKRTC